jgi:hypothetical protein
MGQNDIATGILLIVVGLLLFVIRKPFGREIVDFNKKFFRLEYSEKNTSIVLITGSLFFWIMGVLELFGII